MTFSKWNTPHTDRVIEAISHLLATRNDEAPGDGYERVEYRMRLVTAGCDDGDPDDPTQPYRDVITDIAHIFHLEGWDLDEAIRRAKSMAQQEQAEWDARAAEKARHEDG